MTGFKKWFAALLATSALVLAGAVAMASAAEDTAVNPNALRIGSGPEGKIYQLLVNDIKTVCGPEVPIVNVPSVGGIPNLIALSANQIDLGIVQVDTLRELGRGDDNIRGLQAVMPLHINLLHILSLKGGSNVGPSLFGASFGKRIYGKFSELKKLSIAVVGSTMLLGRKLDTQLGYGMDLQVVETDDVAIRMLKGQKVAAVFTDGGWPLPTIDRLKADSGLMLVEYDLVAQAPFSIVKRNYQSLNAFSVPFLGSPNLLVTRPFRPNGETGKRVAALRNCLLKHLEALQEGRYQPAWKEIKNPTETYGAPLFVSAENNIGGKS